MVFTDPSARPVLDLDGACEFLELSRNEIMVFVPEAMREISTELESARQSLAAAAYPELGRAAHTIKSVAASIGAQESIDAALALELVAMQSQAEACPELFDTLETAVTRLSQVVTDLD